MLKRGFRVAVYERFCLVSLQICFTRRNWCNRKTLSS